MTTQSRWAVVALIGLALLGEYPGVITVAYFAGGLDDTARLTPKAHASAVMVFATTAIVAGLALLFFSQYCVNYPAKDSKEAR